MTPERKSPRPVRTRQPRRDLHVRSEGRNNSRGSRGHQLSVLGAIAVGSAQASAPVGWCRGLKTRELAAEVRTAVEISVMQIGKIRRISK